MPVPAEADLQSQISKAIRIFEHVDRFGGGSTSPNFVTLVADLVAVLEGNFSDGVLSALASPRSKLASILTGDLTAALAPLLLTYGQVIDFQSRDVQAIIGAIYRHFRDNAKRVQSRRFTFGTPTADGGNIGNGTIIRHNLDENAYPIENQTADAKIARCISDQSTGTAKHEEVFQFRGGAPGRDALELDGSGAFGQIAAWSANNARTLANPSFTTTLTATAIPGWTIFSGVIGTFSLDTTNYYRSDLSDAGTPAALKFTGASASIKQTIIANSLALDPNRPHYFRIAFNAEVGTATGTLTVRMGSKSTAIVVDGLTGWKLTAAVGPFWYKEFAEGDLDLTIEWARTGGNLLVDDALFVPGQPFDGSWYWLIGGATPWLREDEWTWTDTEVGGIIQEWLWRGYGRYLPSQLVAPTVACVDDLAGAGAGNVDDGLHTYKYTWVDGNGLESDVSPVSLGVTVADKTVDGKVALTAIAVGPAGTISRKVYRTVAGGAGDFKLLTTIANNSATTYTDNTADAGLGAAAPSQAITFADPA